MFDVAAALQRPLYLAGTAEVAVATVGQKSEQQLWWWLAGLDRGVCGGNRESSIFCAGKAELGLVVDFVPPERQEELGKSTGVYTMGPTEEYGGV